MKLHNYEIRVDWTGNTGVGTKSYRDYRRDHTITAEGKTEILGSSDPAFRGDRSRYNPEELLVAALAACHMLSYLHLCAMNHVTVVEYSDAAVGEMRENPDGSGEFVRVELRPRVKISAGGAERARTLHEEAHRLCFIARSVKFGVEVKAEVAEVHGECPDDLGA